MKEGISTDMPELTGKSVDLSMHVDSKNDVEKETRHLRTKFLILMSTALVRCMSNKQVTSETSVFGAEFVAIKYGIETLNGL